MAVDIGICAYNERDRLPKLLKQIKKEDIPVGRVIVVAGGNDGTIETAESFTSQFDDFCLVKEQSREGQTAAQNKILERTVSEAVFLIDGDGKILPGSLEEMWIGFDGENLVRGKEVAAQESGLAPRVSDILWQIHHLMCLEKPNFTTQLGIMPCGVVDEIPQGVVLDDAYIESMFDQAGKELEYNDDASKIRDIPTDFSLLFSKRVRNWSGHLQLSEIGIDTESRLSTALKHSAAYAARNPAKIHLILILSFIEASAILFSYYLKYKGEYPVIWRTE
jgi:glycosyltransferase involved in cell wall biosynthesis